MGKYLGPVSLGKIVELAKNGLASKQEVMDIINESDTEKLWKHTKEGCYSVIQEVRDGYLVDVCEICGKELRRVEIAPDDEIDNWTYTTEDGYVKLSKYTGEDTEVTVYAAYMVEDEVYKTKIATGNGLFGTKTTITSITFNDGIDYSEMTSTALMFNYCRALTDLTFPNDFDTSHVTDMNNMFNTCAAITTVDLSTFDTSSVTNFSQMFQGCALLTAITFGDKFDTSKTDRLDNLFYGCKALSSLDLTSFITDDVTTMNSMFYNCQALTTLDLRSFDTHKVTNMDMMFNNCTLLTKILATEDKWVIPEGCSTSAMFTKCACQSVSYEE